MKHFPCPSQKKGRKNKLHCLSDWIKCSFQDPVFDAAVSEPQLLQMHKPEMAASSHPFLYVTWLLQQLSTPERDAFSFFQTFSLQIYEVAIIGCCSQPGRIEWPAGRQTYSVISQAWQRRETYAGNMAELTGEYITHRHKWMSQKKCRSDGLSQFRDP